jgi:hypothetical protein
MKNIMSKRLKVAHASIIKETCLNKKLVMPAEAGIQIDFAGCKLKVRWHETAKHTKSTQQTINTGNPITLINIHFS